MFENNAYYEGYKEIISNAKNNPPEKPFEIHHIVPRSMNGSDDPENLVAVSIEDHMKLHTLLPFFTKDKNRENMVYAWNILTHYGKLTDFGEISVLRESFGKIQSARMTGENNPSHKSNQEGKHWNEGRVHTNEVNAKKALPGEKNGMFGKTHSKKVKKMLSKKMVGNDYAKGHKPSEELKKQWSQKHKRTGICEYCGREMNISNLTRYHNNNCKMKDA